MNAPTDHTLTAREVCQQLRDAALGLASLQCLQAQPASGVMQVQIDGWQLSLDVEHGHLHHCQRCQSPDGRVYEPGLRYGTDPVYLLSTWELARIERLLGA
ncbi:MULTISPECIES: hypothetical protein [Pseudomonas]|jgi:hypothetical protein|uniref:DUF7693 domain-containing protein n=2 Tax=Pseudomonas TaxID=286 RepID=A0A9X8EMM7_PSEPU|nr:MULTISPECIES: hypothetical protein [Pseudomonas]KIU53502.1 hypothetical protein QV12_05200 [Pseudomonas putida]KTC24228.1 hypothetical protein AO392_04245 [Pseudomonas putida]MBG8559471.1 hypothetical protein [Pseudomonas qingdaonensis]MCO7505791.1 hypothetical protein [Pseudomonas sp. VE 267-6A]MCO7530627.1 hypothetical protein [Pseudomonas sp. 2]